MTRGGAGGGLLSVGFRAGGGTYRALIGPGAMEAAPPCGLLRGRRVAIVGDETVAGLYAGGLRDAVAAAGGDAAVFAFPAGEASKTARTVERLADGMAAAGLGRDCVVAALGGGVSLDIGGFAAAAFMRGVPYASFPTSLLAQVDAAYGGKTGVNLPSGKNLLGVFHQPSAVFADTSLLATLPDGEWRCGLAELVKHAAVGDARLFGRLEAAAPAPGRVDPALLADAVRVKARVVAADPSERGVRRVLNFGHTAGHAIESASAYAVPHGMALAAGMMVEARLAAATCGFPAGHVRRLGRLLERLGLPVAPQVAFGAAARYLPADKKNRGGRVRAALPARIGSMVPAGGEYAVDVDLELLERAWDGR